MASNKSADFLTLKSLFPHIADDVIEQHLKVHTGPGCVMLISNILLDIAEGDTPNQGIHTPSGSASSSMFISNVTNSSLPSRNVIVSRAAQLASLKQQMSVAIHRRSTSNNSSAFWNNYQVTSTRLASNTASHLTSVNQQTNRVSHPQSISNNAASVSIPPTLGPTNLSPNTSSPISTSDNTLAKTRALMWQILKKDRDPTAKQNSLSILAYSSSNSTAINVSTSAQLYCAASTSTSLTQVSSSSVEGNCRFSSPSFPTSSSSSTSKTADLISRLAPSRSGVLTESSNAVVTNFPLPSNPNGGLKITGFGFGKNQRKRTHSHTGDSSPKKSNTSKTLSKSSSDSLINKLPSENINQNEAPDLDSIDVWFQFLQERFPSCDQDTFKATLVKFRMKCEPNILSLTIQDLENREHSPYYNDEVPDENWTIKWYWKNSAKEMGKKLDAWSSDKLEAQYQLHVENKGAVKIFMRCTGPVQSYDVNFFTMKTEKPTVLFLTRLKLGDGQPKRSEVAVDTPITWCPQQKDKQIFQVSEGTDEWKTVHKRFATCMPRVKVVRIERIQNRWLHKQYFMQKKLMEEKNGKDFVNELLLFHGTRTTDPCIIWRSDQGFDLRHCQGGAWGVGAYFAENSSYSDSFAYLKPGRSREKQMFLAKVLTGHNTQLPQNPTLRMPPIRTRDESGGNVLYDSVSGVQGLIRIFIIYELNKAYPEYLVTYR